MSCVLGDLTSSHARTIRLADIFFHSRLKKLAEKMTHAVIHLQRVPRNAERAIGYSILTHIVEVVR